MKKEEQRRRQFEGCVVAALETCAKLRSPQAGANPSGPNTDPIGRIIATIEAESARIQARDPSAVDAVFASQALALDTLFSQLARQGVEDGWLSRDTLALALKAQLQSRTTLKSLASPMTPPGEGGRERQIQPVPGSEGSDPAQKPKSGEQTIESENS